MKKLIALLVVSLSSVTLHAQSVWINENVDRDTGLRTREISLRGGFYTIGLGENPGGAHLTGADLFGCGDREEGPSSGGMVSAAETETVKADKEVVPGQPEPSSTDVEAERPPPQTFSDFRKLVGSSLSEEEKQFVGRWSGEDNDGRWWVINRADHTHSYLERGPDGKESLFAHGSWAIRNGVLHVLAWVNNGHKNFSAGMDQLKPMELKQEGAIEGFGVLPISSLRDDEIVYEDGFKERRIEAFEEPEMKPFNTPEALKTFDLLKVYKEASAETDSERLHKAILEKLPSDEALKKALQGLPLTPAPKDEPEEAEQ